MRFFDQLPHRDYEEALRSLGRLLDDHRLEDILVMELADGFMTTGLRPSPFVDSGGQLGARQSYEHAEALFVDPAVDAASKHGQTLRGSGREAGRYEQALRLIGRRVNADEGALVLVVDQGDGYLLRVGLQYHWHNDGYRDFDDYLAAFRSKRRNQIRRERRALAADGVEIEVVAGDEIADHPGGEHLARIGGRHDACAGVHRDAGETGAAALALARVDACPDVDAERRKRVANFERAANGARRVDTGNQALRGRLFVPGRAVDLSGQEQPRHPVSLESRLEFGRMNEIVFNCVSGSKDRC